MDATTEAVRNTVSGGVEAAVYVAVAAALVVVVATANLVAVAALHEGRTDLADRGFNLTRTVGDIGSVADCELSTAMSPATSGAVGAPVQARPLRRSDTLVSVFPVSPSVLSILYDIDERHWTALNPSSDLVPAVIGVSLATRFGVTAGEVLAVSWDQPGQEPSRFLISAVLPETEREVVLDGAVAVLAEGDEVAQVCFAQWPGFPAVAQRRFISAAVQRTPDDPPQTVPLVDPAEIADVNDRFHGRTARWGWIAAVLTAVSIHGTLQWGRRSELALYRAVGMKSGVVSHLVIVETFLRTLAAVIVASVFLAPTLLLSSRLLDGPVLSSTLRQSVLILGVTPLLAGLVTASMMRRLTMAEVVKGG